MKETHDTLAYLKSRIAELEGRLVTLQRIITDHDERIRSLQHVTIIVTAGGIRIERNQE
jgi:prefoldin subunit 5